jgi:alcohol dehydrogenase (cytochrome c)
MARNGAPGGEVEMRFGSTGCRAVTPHARVAAAIAALVVVVATAAGCGSGGAPARHAASGSTHPSPTQTSPTGLGRPWAAPNADPANTRRVDGPIDAASVSRLRRAWTVPLAGAGYATTPVVSHGVVYLQDLSSDVSAISLRSGTVLWTKRFEEQNVGPNGVNVAHGRVFGATNTQVFALSAKTGARLWSRTIVRNNAEAIDMAPGYKDGTVYVSPAVRSGGSAGVLWALDAATGRAKWKWAEVPARLWGHPEVNAGGGLWHPPAFDGHGGLYVGIGNPLPFLGTAEAPWGASRPGANKWDNSIVKLDARTGKFLWGRQVLPHDVYDWDLECPVILAKARGRTVALAAGKMGIVYAFDAATGAMLWKRPVGLHNGHDDDNLLAMRRQYSKLRLGVKVYPGNWGGVQTPMASDGSTVYVPVNDLYVVYRSQTESQQQDLMQGTGEIVAIDIASGRVKWDRRLPHSTYGAATVSNDLVFTTTFEGKVWALDTHTGRVAWTSGLPAGTDAPVAVSGDTLITAGSLPLQEGQQPAIVAYRLAAKDGGSAR